MGCDIHAFIEVEDGIEQPYRALFDGRINLRRDYRVFAALAGVRSLKPPLFPPRGFPPDVSEEVFDHYYVGVIDESDLRFYRGYNFLTPTEAAGLERLPPETKRYGVIARHGWVPYGDWHTASWLLLPEIQEALHLAGLVPSDLDPEYRLLLDTLAAAERQLGHQVRLVFWFDN